MLLRMQPMKNPLLMDLYVDQYLFYIPYRLLWDGWEDFLSAGPAPDGSGVPPSAPTANEALFQRSDGALSYNIFENRALNLVYNEYFRDQQWQTPVAPDTVATPGSGGHPAEAIQGQRQVNAKRTLVNEIRKEDQIGGNHTVAVSGGAFGALTVDVENIMREAAMAKLQMRRATYGTRYVDILKSYGVNITVAMLQRPEVCAAAHGTINVTDVVSTGEPGADGLGQFSGYAVKGNRLSMRRKTFSEHGVLLGCIVVRPCVVDPAIGDYLDKTRPYAAYYDPALEPIPHQVMNFQDFYHGAISGGGAVTAGYVPFYEWYRRATNRQHRELGGWAVEQVGPSLRTVIGGSVLSQSDFVHCFMGTNYTDQQNTDVDLLFNIAESTPETVQWHYVLSAVNHLRAARAVGTGTVGGAAK